MLPVIAQLLLAAQRVRVCGIERVRGKVWTSIVTDILAGLGHL